jgi:hypothetical protein
MKQIKIAAPTVVNTSPIGAGAGELRHPIEGALTVTDEEAKRLKDNRLLDGEPEDLPSESDEVESEDHDDDLDDQTLADLKILVTKKGVPLHGATSKADVIAAIRNHREPAA